MPDMSEPVPGAPDAEPVAETVPAAPEVAPPDAKTDTSPDSPPAATAPPQYLDVAWLKGEAIRLLKKAETETAPGVSGAILAIADRFLALAKDVDDF